MPVVLHGLATIDAFERGIVDAPGAARQGVPCGGSRAREEQGRDAAVGGVPGERDSREEAVGTVAHSAQGGRRVHGGARGQEPRLDGRQEGQCCVSGDCSAAAAVGDAQALATEEAKVGVQCYKTDGATAVVVRLTERVIADVVALLVGGASNGGCLALNLPLRLEEVCRQTTRS
jgi:hypothetical protein